MFMSEINYVIMTRVLDLVNKFMVFLGMMQYASLVRMGACGQDRILKSPALRTH